MPETAHGYSEVARLAAEGALDGWAHHEVAVWVMDAAHDRERLGLEASVHAAAFLDEIVTKLWEWDGIPEADRRKAVAFLLREFGATNDQ